ncbi:hypothetical protein J43TS9_51710 [Paenibacillus cineris]|nr:hypothetical protein J43TS9_51710 [Paenibacillus cineris]
MNYCDSLMGQGVKKVTRGSNIFPTGNDTIRQLLCGGDRQIRIILISEQIVLKHPEGVRNLNPHLAQ